jgi:hypothetical protein
MSGMITNIIGSNYHLPWRGLPVRLEGGCAVPNEGHRLESFLDVHNNNRPQRAMLHLSEIVRVHAKHSSPQGQCVRVPPPASRLQFQLGSQTWSSRLGGAVAVADPTTPGRSTHVKDRVRLTLMVSSKDSKMLCFDVRRPFVRTGSLVCVRCKLLRLYHFHPIPLLCLALTLYGKMPCFRSSSPSATERQGHNNVLHMS